MIRHRDKGHASSNGGSLTAKHANPLVWGAFGSTHEDVARMAAAGSLGRPIDQRVPDKKVPDREQDGLKHE